MRDDWFNEYGLAVDRQLTDHLQSVRSSLAHSGAKGSALELRLAPAIGRAIGGSSRFGNGQIIDTSRTLSNQVDVVLHDGMQPFLPVEEWSPALFIADSVQMAIEVKADLRPSHLRELASASGGARAVKRLRRHFGPGDTIPVTITRSEFLRFYNRIGYIVVAYETSSKVSSLGNALAELEYPTVRTTSEPTRVVSFPAIDAVFIIGTGTFINSLSVDGEPAFGLSLHPDTRSSHDFGLWHFYPKVDSEGYKHSTIHRLGAFLTWTLPRIVRRSPPITHYYAQPIDPSMKVNVGDVLVSDYLRHKGIDSRFVHHH